MRKVVLAFALFITVGAAASSSPLKTGAWEMAVEIESIEPATPQLQPTKGKPLVFGTCVSPERLRVSGMHLPFTWPSGECTPIAFTGENGVVTGTFECRGDLGMVEVELAGTYTPGSYDVRTTEKATRGAGGRSGLTLVRHTVGRFAGACKKSAAHG